MNIFKLTFRTLIKFRIYTIMNIAGLTICITCFVLLTKYIHQEATVNGFVPELESLYLMTVQYKNSTTHLGGASNPNGDKNFIDPLIDPTVEKYSRMITFVDDWVNVDENQFSTNILVADSNFLKIIPYPVLYGTNTLKSPTDAIITDNFAKRVLKNKNPIGEKIQHSTTGQILTIIGVIGEAETKSVFDFDLIINITSQDYWFRNNYSLVKLYKGADFNQINKKNKEYRNYSHYGDIAVRYQLIPFEDFYLNSPVEVKSYESIFKQGNRSAITILSLASILIILVGIFNFISIYNVVTYKRAREFELKKVYGAKPRQVFHQIYLENFIQASISIFFAWLILEVFGDNILNSYKLIIIPDKAFSIWLTVGLLFFLPLITSVFPYYKYNFSKQVSKISFQYRKLFLFIQYVITFSIVVTAMYFMKQLNFMLKAELGYNIDNVITARLLNLNNPTDFNNFDAFIERNKQLHERVEIIKERMNSSPLFSEWIFLEPQYTLKPVLSVKKLSDDEYKSVALINMSVKHLEMFNFQILEGRLWDSTDVPFQYRAIINETAKKYFNINHINKECLQPETALWMTDNKSENKPYEIVGVIKDFNTGHLSQSTTPLLILFEEDNSFDQYVVARITHGKENEVFNFFEDLNVDLYGKTDFEYSFWNDRIKELYEEDIRVSNIYISLALIAIIISCLGLFAISLFDVRQRYREIALRKVNGATSKDIMRLLLRKYIFLLTFSFTVAIPISFLIVYKLMESFAHKTTVSWWLFVIAMLVVAGVSLLTLTWQVRRAMKINPAKALKIE